MRNISPSSISLGKVFPYSIYDKSGILLFRQGSVISMPSQVTRLIARGAQYNEDEILLNPATQAGANHNSPLPLQEQSPFENLSGLILNLKHALLTALRDPEKIDVGERISQIALAVQRVCQDDVDSALAAAYIDANNPYIVVHQMMGAVLTELVAQGKGLNQAQRLPLVCAALTRDLSQLPIQVEMDKHKGPLPDELRHRMYQHPNQSADLLARAGVTDVNWLRAVREHHERLDGGGYPEGLTAEQISTGAKILAVSDTYSAMVKPVAYRATAHNAQNVLKEIYQKKDKEFDGEIARILITKVGLLPPGTIVKLKCGEIAVIKSPTVKAEGAKVYTIYGKTGVVLMEPIRRDTSQAGYEITGLVSYAECRTAAVLIKRVWAM